MGKTAKITNKKQDWLALAIGNSRLHWAWFRGEVIQLAWDSQHLSGFRQNCQIPPEVLPPNQVSVNLSQLPLCIASVVPEQTLLWRNAALVQVITLSNIPLNNLYSNLGIDRALAVWGAGDTYGFPCLVVDAGTALTFTGVDGNHSLVGGAILPGLRLQFQALGQHTAALPEVELTSTLPLRWAVDTITAIESGIIYTVLAGIANFIVDWWQQFPNSSVVFTGGDAYYLYKNLPKFIPEMATKTKLEPHLLFWGMRLAYLQSNQSKIFKKN
ncbi:putative transcriptional acitvator, Baf family [Stanieria cyanosphaera PCC 7437]|uniref:Type III pantothenate kinase n=1 Tax=Stanieria cyanosphaera (strain ATCC 29371 / PCC 7437) TaxID=111780 RepID=K9XNH5_STAC7|nr:pantothenate kinase [Stanieria cyanosphaera]AFZ34165.1 putative transcriptional acitvator, Baf family [Stanieria cyanosphaera PCC 7437]